MTYWVAVVDDDSANLRVADHILTHGGFRVTCLDSGHRLLDFIQDNKPDLILLDLHMEEMDGLETMTRLRMTMNGVDIPVIIVTADDDPDTEAEALSAGAVDFVTKPYAAAVLQLRIGNTIELNRLQNDLQNEVSRMTSEILAEHEKFERLSLQIVKTLAGTIDAKDSYTNGHSVRVAEYAREIAKRAGYSEKAQEDIYMVGLLHDVGKIGIPDTVINKPSRLTDEEYAMIKTHPTVGFEILRNINEMPKLAVGARWHHERYDGKGYPDGIAGTDIPEEARIIAVADAYDAMSSRRSYHNVLDQEYILGEFKRGKGVQFDPKFADIMIAMIEDDVNYLMHEREETKAKPVQVEIVNQDNESKEKTAALFSMLESCGLNVESGMKYCMNDVNFYIEMLNEFTSGTEERMVNLNGSLINEDWNKYRINVHSLKSVCKTLGAEELSEMARQSEEAAKNSKADFVKENHRKIIEHLTRMSENILAVTAIITLK